MDLLAISLGIATAAFFAYLRQPPPLPLAKRKDWLRTYFVKALDVDGRVADAFWFCDPWLSGPHDSSKETMRKFYPKFFDVLIDYYGFAQTGLLCCRKGISAIYVNQEVEHQEFKSLYFLFTDNRNGTYLFWNRDGTYKLRTEDTWRNETKERQLSGFNEYRQVLLQIAHLLVTKQEVAFVEAAKEVPTNRRLETLQFIWKVFTLIFVPVLFTWLFLLN